MSAGQVLELAHDPALRQTVAQVRGWVQGRRVVRMAIRNAAIGRWPCPRCLGGGNERDGELIAAGAVVCTTCNGWGYAGQYDLDVPDGER